jgi:threonine/homoserine/homoserine lactone efflux protein
MLFQGILLGLSLSFLVGPLLFAVVEAGIAQGFRAGVAVAAGIWASDVLYVLVAMFGLQSLEALTGLPHFKWWAGMLGGLILMAFGANSFFKHKAPQAAAHAESASFSIRKNYSAWWLRGFLLNTVNPGTIFFWLGITSAVVVPNGWGRREMLVFFGGMLFALVLTDTLKAWGAKRLRAFLTPTHTQQVQRGLGLLLMIFGAVLLLRSLNN